MNILEHVSKTVKKARKAKGLKQEALGERVGCAGSYITKLEKGYAIPAITMAVKLENELGMRHGTLWRKLRKYEALKERLKKKALAEARRAHVA